MDLEAWFRNVFYWIFTARFFEDRAAVDGALGYAVDYPYPQSAVGLERQVAALAGYNGAEGLSRISARSLVVAGKEDLLFPVDVCADLARAIPGAAFSVIEGAAHSIHMEQSRMFTDRVLDFLRGG